MFEFIGSFFSSMFSVILHSPLWWACIILGILATFFYPKFRGVNDTIEMYKKGKKRMYKNVHEN